jgi:alpha-L-fucosidase
VYGEGPAKAIDGGFSEDKQSPYGPQDLRFSTREGLLYVLGLAAPDGGRIEIRSLGSDLALYQGRIARIELLGHTKEFAPHALEFEQRRDALSVRLPESWDPQPGSVPFPVLRITPER